MPVLSCHVENWHFFYDVDQAEQNTQQKERVEELFKSFYA